jgi:hypothetical protein
MNSKNFAVRRDLDRDCPFVRTVGIGSFLSVCCGRSFWLMGTLRGKERILGRFCSFSGVHALRDDPFPQFTNRIACMGFYHRGDALGGIANRRLQNTRYLGPLWFSALVICYRHGYKSRHQDAARLFGFLGGRCRIFTGILRA